MAYNIKDAAHSIHPSPLHQRVLFFTFFLSLDFRIERIKWKLFRIWRKEWKIIQQHECPPQKIMGISEEHRNKEMSLNFCCKMLQILDITISKFSQLNIFTFIYLFWKNHVIVSFYLFRIQYFVFISNLFWFLQTFLYYM